MQNYVITVTASSDNANLAEIETLLDSDKVKAFLREEVGIEMHGAVVSNDEIAERIA